MNRITPFQYAGQQVRTVLVDGEPWFVIADIAKVLGLTNPTVAANSLFEDDLSTTEVIDSLRRTQTARITNEAGMYRLIFQSRKAEAQEFQRWVTHEVLPQIRRTGSFHQTEVEHALPQSYADALRALAETVERQEALEAKVAADAPKVDAYDQLMDADGFYSMEAAAKIIGVGRNTFYELLRQAGIIRPASRLPYQRYMHHFKIVTGSRPDGRGGFKPYETTKIRPSGLGFVLPKVAPGFNVRALTS